MALETQQVDPTALALSRAIRSAEGGDYTNYSGDNGTSAGAYQWNNGKVKLTPGQVPKNFQEGAKTHGLDPNDFSQTNQDHLAYEQIKKDLDSGLTQSQIAAKWNSGLTTGWENHKGTTTIAGKTISYDTPAYVAKVQKFYQDQTTNPQQTQSNLPASQQSSVQFNPTYPQTEQPIPQENDNTLANKFTGRINDANQAITDYTSGKQGLLSTGIQTVGAGAGLLGDSVNSLIEHTPILGGLVKGLESSIGGGVSSFLGTDAGRGILTGVSQFAKDHPELSKDIGAGINIVSAIPILKGLGTGINLIKDAGSLALKGAAEKAATEGLTNVISSTGKGGRSALARNPEAVKTLVTERAIPDIVDGKYNVKDAFDKLQERISHIDENELQTVLDKASVEQIAKRIPLETYKHQAMADAIDQLKDTAPIEAYFKRLQTKYGDYPTLKEMNEAKRIVSNNISEAGFNSPSYSVDKIVRSTLQKSVEDGASALGLPDVAAINQKMANLIKAQDMLSYINGKTVKSSLIGDVATIGATAAAAGVGAMAGFSPEVSGYLGNRVTNMVGKKLKGFSLGVLNRTGKDAERTTTGEAYRGLVGNTKINPLKQNGLTRGLLQQSVVSKTKEANK